MHLHKGKEYFEQNEFQKAREELEAAYHFRPQDEKVLNLLGMTYFKLEMLPQAEEMYVTLAANNPEIYTLQSNLGLIRLKLNKLEQAEESLTSALELQPTNPKAHFYLGLLYEKLQKWDKALGHFEQAKADKMIAKMKEKLAENEKEEEILPFEVLEVLVEEEAFAQQQQFEPGYMPEALVAEKLAYREETPYVGEKEIVGAESEWIEHNVSTGKMHRRDVIEALERLEQRESDQVMDDAVPMPGHPVEEEALWKNSLTESDAAPAEAALNPVEEAEAQERSNGRSAASEEEFLNPIETPSASFLIPEETAADISAFLAQSRLDQQQIQNDSEESEKASSWSDEPSTDHTFPRPEVQQEEPLDESTDVEQIEEQPAEEEVLFDEPIEVANEAVEQPAEALAMEEENIDLPAEERVVDETQMMSAIVSASAVVEEQMPAGIEKEPEQIEAAAPTSEPETSVFGGERKLDPVTPSYQATNLDQFSRDRFYVQPLIGADRFLLIDPHLLEIIISEKLICRKGTISSFTGNLQFQPLQMGVEQPISFVQVAGSGVLFLADRRQEIFIVSLNNESIYVEANHLIVAQSSLKVEPQSFEQNAGETRFSFMKISGRGTIALTCHTKPLTLNVFEAMPANIPADAIIAWSGMLTPSSISDDELRNIMTSGEQALILRFAGNGDVVVEQGGLWGDRRSK